MEKLKVISLFSGAGGLDLGFIQSGFYNILFANDILQSPIKTHSINFNLNFLEYNNKIKAQKNIALVCNIKNIDFSPLKDENIDLIIGGPPCQDFTLTRGKDRKGIEVKRGRLYSYFIKALIQIQPKAFLFENVYGLLTANKGLAYKYILEDFSNLNLRWNEIKKEIKIENNIKSIQGYYIIHSKVLDFSYFGVPQKRKRLIIIGIRKDLIKNSKELKKIKYNFNRKLKQKMGLFPKYPLTTIETFEGKRLDELNDIYKEIIKKWDGIWFKVNNEYAWEWKLKVWNKLIFDIIQDYILANKIKTFDKKEFEKALDQHEKILKELKYYGIPVYSLKLNDNSNETLNHTSKVIERMKRIPFDESHRFVYGTKWGIKMKGKNFLYKRLHPLKPSYTILAHTHSHGFHYDRDRIELTLRERARLQTFPDSFIFSGTKTEILSQIGEAVPPLAAKRLAEVLVKILLNLEIDINNH
jgi:DNA (cytosine-5)-methyltransferase 1